MTATVTGGPEGRITTSSTVVFSRTAHGRREMVEPRPAAPIPLGRIPRISRLMALAIRFRDLIDSGEVRDYAEFARLGHVTRARLSQIMNLACLAPDIQEALLFLATVQCGRDPVKEWEIRPIAAIPDWRKQRQMCGELRNRAARPPSE